MVNPGEFVGGAGLGTALGLLCEAIIELIRKNHMFSPLLKEIKSTLDSLAPLIAQMSQSNQQLPYAKPDELQGLEAVLNGGKVIVAKCETLSEWNYIRRYRYANKLIGWKEKFEKQSIVQMQMARDVKAMGIGVQNIEATTKNIEVSAVTTQVSTAKLEVSVGNLTEELGTIKISTKKIEVLTENLDVSVGNLTEEVKNMKEEVNQKIKENSGIQDLSEFSEAWSAVPELPQHPVGLDVPLDELKKKLFGDGLSKLVLTGPGGCGKTTLVSKFCRDEQVKDEFKNNIFFVTISKDLKMYDIVKQLYEQKGEKAPAFTNEESAANMLPKFLKEKGKSPLLLVLDDVWSGSELLLEKCDRQMTGYKVLVTSRSQLEGFDSTHVVQLLDDKNAMKLIHHSAELSSSKFHISEAVVREIVDYCEGFPLALKLVGLSLRGKPETVWSARVTEWSSGSSSIFDPQIQLLRCLQSSIDELNKEMPVTGKCFLDLSSFPQNKYIPVATLFDMWAELYNLDKDNLLIAKLYELNSRSLANLVDKREVNMEPDGYYSQHFIILHGLIRELAIYLSRQDKKAKDRKRLMIKICGENRPKWWRKSQTMQARLLSISTDEEFSMEWPNIQLPNAKVLLLFFQTQDYVLPKFVEEMLNLKVLVITCDGSYVLGAALNSFQPLNQLSNLKAIILEGISIPSITKNPILLESVKKISLSRCYEVSEAFRDSIKISHFFPKLEVMNIDFCNLVELPTDLGCLTLLRELNITNCCGLSTLPEGMEKLVNLEVLRLRFCRDFSKFRHSIKLQRLKSLDLAYCSSMEELPKYLGELSSLEKLNTRNCPGLNELPRSMSNLKQLEVVICSSKTKLLTESLPYGENIPMVAPTLNWDDFN